MVARKASKRLQYWHDGESKQLAVQRQFKPMAQPHNNTHDKKKNEDCKEKANINGGLEMIGIEMNKNITLKWKGRAIRRVLFHHPSQNSHKPTLNFCFYFKLSHCDSMNNCRKIGLLWHHPLAPQQLQASQHFHCKPFYLGIYLYFSQMNLLGVGT